MMPRVPGRLLIGLLLAGLLLGVACQSPTQSREQATIVEPSPGQDFGFASQITFRARGGGSSDLVWRLGNGDLIGRGITVTATFVPGAYEANLLDSDGPLDQISFRVLPPLYETGRSVTYVQMSPSQVVPLAPGRYHPALVNGSDQTLTPEILMSAPPNPSASVLPRDPGQRLLDWYVPRPDPATLNGPLHNGATRPRMGSTAQSEGTTDPVFTVPDPVDGGTTVHTIEAHLLVDQPDFVIWGDTESVIAPLDVDHLRQAASVILPRCRELFGSWQPTNGDPRVHILLSPILNRGGVAVGFFNPADVFPSDYTDQRQMVSNGLNLLTLGVPEATPPSGSFSVDSLSATIAHELFHLILFQRKSRPAYLAGSLSPPVEETFLDEGLAHLSETLNGYGISGGNIWFALRYAQEPHRFSLSGRSVDGQFDSVGRRGGMLLLLSHLFWHLGGFSIDAEGLVTDRGGISFLKKIVNDPATGWSVLSKAAGASHSQIIANWLTQEVPMTGPSTRAPSDPFTKQLLGIGLTTTPYRTADGTEARLHEFGVVGGEALVASDTIVLLPPLSISSWPTLNVSINGQTTGFPSGIASLWFMDDG